MVIMFFSLFLHYQNFIAKNLARIFAGFVAAVHAVVGFVDVVDVDEFVDVDTVDIVDIVDDVVVDDGGDKVAVVVHAEMSLWRNLEMDREP